MQSSLWTAKNFCSTVHHVRWMIINGKCQLYSTIFKLCTVCSRLMLILIYCCTQRCCKYQSHKYKYKYLTLKYKYKYSGHKYKYKYKYFKMVLEYYSSTSTNEAQT